MQVTNFNTKAASLALASVVAALTPVVTGYFSVSVEIGNDMMASVGGLTRPTLEILTSIVFDSAKIIKKKQITTSHP